MSVARSLSRASCVAGLLAHMTLAHGSPVELFSETFNNIVFPPGGGGDPRIFGVPTTNGAADLSTSTIGNADENWYAARFQTPDAGAPFQDVGVQQVGGSGNDTPVGIAEDDAGLLAMIDTTGYQDITVRFRWRTFQSESRDRFVFGYFVGNLLDIVSPSLIDMDNRSLDLRTAADGGADGVWNWIGGNWTQLLRAGPNDSFSTAAFDLVGAGNGQVWLAFWLDDGEGDFVKFDNVVVKGTLVPLPAALPLLLSGLLGFALLHRRSA